MKEIDDAKRTVLQAAPKLVMNLINALDDPNPKARAEALAGLKRNLPTIRAMCDSPEYSPEIKRKLAAALKRIPPA